jgi:hypothetical protein
VLLIIVLIEGTDFDSGVYGGMQGGSWGHAKVIWKS